METPKPTEETKPCDQQAAEVVPAPPSVEAPLDVEQYCAEGELRSENDSDPREARSEQGTARSFLPIDHSGRTITSRPVQHFFAQTRSRRRWLRYAPAVAVGVLSVADVAAISVAFQAIHSQREANAQRQHAEQALATATESSSQIVLDLSRRLRAFADLPPALSKEILDRTRALQESFVAGGTVAPAALPGAIAALNENALTLESIGDIGGAYDATDRVRQIIEQRLSADPGNTNWQHELSISYERLGGLQLTQRKLQEALKFRQASLALRDRLAAADPSNSAWQRDLGVAYEKIGDVQLALGNLPEAAESYQANLSIRDRLIKADPGNARLARDLAVSYYKLGDLHMAQKNWSEALESYQAGLPISERLAEANPDNEPLHRDLAALSDRIGDAETAQGNLAEGLKSFQVSFLIRERIAKFEPDNTDWQRDLVVSYGKIAKVYREMGRITAAIDGLRRGREILAHLKQLSPGNAVIENYLARFDGQIAELTRDAAAAPE
jgi:tetratricopeptide (TPR) repeat protein